MNRWALIEGGRVIAITAQVQQPPGWVDVTNTAVSVGDVDNGQGGYAPPAEARPRVITRLAFRHRFTLAERVRLKLASVIDPSASLQARTTAATLAAYLEDVDAATFIDLSRSDTRAGVEAVQAIPGLLDSAGRAAEILDGPISEAERFKG